MLSKASRWIKRLVFGSMLCMAVPGQSLTLEELQCDSALAPQNFARHFASFKFRFHPAVQPPEIFLARQTGDCDDYATLAALLLKENGYTPRLFSVRMEKEVHVVCYVEESRAYLDFNRRHAGNGLMTCGNALPEIAGKVAESFGAAWQSVSEFTFRDGQKRLVQVVLPSGGAPGIAQPPQPWAARILASVGARR